MKLLCTKGFLYLTLTLLVVGAAACTQNRPAVPTPTLVPLINDTPVAPVQGQPTAIIEGQPTPENGAPTLVPPTGNETPVPAAGETPLAPTDNQPTPIIVEPTLFPTPTTVGDTSQPVPTAETGNQQSSGTGSCTNPYTVQPGEWFYAIARKCGITPQALIAANPTMNPSFLRPGQVLVIPGGGQSPVQPGTDNQQPSQPSGSCTNPYTVQRGDTLNSIARKCGTTAAALQRANGIPSPDYIFPGQQIRIP